MPMAATPMASQSTMAVKVADSIATEKGMVVSGPVTPSKSVAPAKTETESAQPSKSKTAPKSKTGPKTETETTPPSKSKKTEPKSKMTQRAKRAQPSKTPSRSPSNAATAPKRAMQANDNKPTTPPRAIKSDRDEISSREAAAAAYRSLATSIWSNVLAPPLVFTTGVLSDTLFFLRPFLGMALAMSIFAMLVWITATWAYAKIWGTTVVVSNAVDPVAAAFCSLPVVSLAPWCPPKEPAKQNPVAFNSLVVVQDHTFGKLLDLSEEGLELPSIMFKGASSISQLRDIVFYRSQLQSKEQLAQHMDNYVELSRNVSFSFPSFTIRIGYAVDSIIYMNRKTLRFLEEVQREPNDSFLNRLTRLLPGASRGYTYSDVIDQYLLHANLVEEEINELIGRIDPVERNLKEMEDELVNVRTLTASDVAVLVKDRGNHRGSVTDLFAQLYVLLVQRPIDPGHVERNIAFAERLGGARENATKVMQLAMIELQVLRTAVEKMKDRIGDPRSWKGENANPLWIEEHVRCVKDGLERLLRQRADQRGRTEAYFENKEGDYALRKRTRALPWWSRSP
jgi:hypothetical protein